MMLPAIIIVKMAAAVTHNLNIFILKINSSKLYKLKSIVMEKENRCYTSFMICLKL